MTRKRKFTKNGKRVIPVLFRKKKKKPKGKRPLAKK